MKKTCETCRHCRDFKVIGVEFFPTICKAPTAKKHEFAVRFTEVMRKDGWLKSWWFNTCGKQGRWWQEKGNKKPIGGYQPVKVSDETVSPPPRNPGGIDKRDQWGFPPIDPASVPPMPRIKPPKDAMWFDEAGKITPEQWDALSRSIHHHGDLKP